MPARHRESILSLLVRTVDWLPHAAPAAMSEVSCGFGETIDGGPFVQYGKFAFGIEYFGMLAVEAHTFVAFEGWFGTVAGAAGA